MAACGNLRKPLGLTLKFPLFVFLSQAGTRLSPSVINRLAKELRELQLKPEEGIKVTMTPSI